MTADFVIVVHRDKDGVSGAVEEVAWEGKATRSEDPARVVLNLSGISRIDVEASTADSCSSASKGYASLVQSYVF